MLLIDDHPVIRRGLTEMFEQEPDLAVCGQAGSVAEALAVLQTATPDIAVVDISLDGADGLQLVKQINARWPAVLLLVLSMHEERLFAERAIRAGAHGYIMKSEPPEQVVRAIRRVSEGGVYVSERLQSEWLRQMRSGKPRALTPVESLTDRELAVFRLIGEGQSTREIATQLVLSVKTIETHREHIKKKLDLRSATQLVQRATLWLHMESDV